MTPYEISENVEQDNYHDVCVREGWPPFQLKHRDTCLGEAHFCRGWRVQELITWRATTYLVAIPTCRDEYMRRIINAVEEFGRDVGWVPQDRPGLGVVREGFGRHGGYLFEYFPQLTPEQYRTMRARVDAVVVPAARAAYRSYYWWRDVAAAVRTEARNRGRLRCLACRRIYSWAQYDRWLVKTHYGHYYKPVFCDNDCERTHAARMRRAAQRERRELEWLKRGEDTLRKIRRLLKHSPNDLHPVV